MGTLRSYDIEVVTDEFGNETKVYLAQGLVVNGVLLGEPIEIDGDPNTAEWDDSRLPSGIIHRDGEIILDEESNGI
jgi:hypothetical protein